jgi:hypothetical protein
VAVRDRALTFNSIVEDFECLTSDQVIKRALSFVTDGCERETFRSAAERCSIDTVKILGARVILRAEKIR